MIYGHYKQKKGTQNQKEETVISRVHNEERALREFGPHTKAREKEARWAESSEKKLPNEVV